MYETNPPPPMILSLALPHSSSLPRPCPPLPCPSFIFPPLYTVPLSPSIPSSGIFFLPRPSLPLYFSLQVFPLFSFPSSLPPPPVPSTLPSTTLPAIIPSLPRPSFPLYSPSPPRTPHLFPSSRVQHDLCITGQSPACTCACPGYMRGGMSLHKRSTARTRLTKRQQIRFSCLG